MPAAANASGPLGGGARWNRGIGALSAYVASNSTVELSNLGGLVLGCLGADLSHFAAFFETYKIVTHFAPLET